jgi:hypothetical protein
MGQLLPIELLPERRLQTILADLDLRFGSTTVPNEDPRNLTRWLHAEMVENVDHPLLQAVKGLNQGAETTLGLGLGTFIAGCVAGGPVTMLAGGLIALSGTPSLLAGRELFSSLVGHGQIWDFKHRILARLGPGITLCSNRECSDEIEYSVPGNVHFGFVGREASYPGSFIHLGAAGAERDDPSHVLGHPKYTPYEGNRGLIWGTSGLSLNLGDEQMDHQAVQFGIHLYNKYGRGLTLSQFRSELGHFMKSFATEIPQGIVAEDTARDWPYWVGYFKPFPEDQQ